jgi:pimeloyl-ACP methyl ester carboxylesterase
MVYSRYIVTQSKKKIHILSWITQSSNPRQKECCVLLHGVSNNAAIWSKIAEGLSLNYDVFAIDFRGHGDSDWNSDGQYHHSHFVEDVIETIQTLRLMNIHLIGHSLGARIASLALLKQPNIAKSFTIVDYNPTIAAASSEKIKTDLLNTPDTFKTLEDYTKHLSKIYIFSDHSELTRMSNNDLRADQTAWRLKFDKHVVRSLWSASRASIQPELWKAIDSIVVPTLIIRGKISAILNAKQAVTLNNILQNSTLVTVDRSGHSVITDNPDATLIVLLNFLNNNSQ